MKIIDMFCGCGGMGGGFEDAGFEIVQAFDYDKFAIQSYNANFETKAEQLDIREINADYLKPADGWTFGFSCQPFSVAGRQMGMKFKCTFCKHEEYMDSENIIDRNTFCTKCGSKSVPKDPRGILFFEVMRLLKNVKEKPKFILAENVKGIKKYLPIIKQQFSKRGYDTYITLYNAKYWGLPQNRERYFILGIRNDINVNFKFPEQQTNFVPPLWSILEDNVDEKYYIDDEKAEKIIEQATKKVKHWGNVHACLTPNRVTKKQNGRRVKEADEEMFTLTAQDIHGIIELQKVFLAEDDVSYCLDANYYKGISPGDIGNGRRTHIVELYRPKSCTKCNNDDIGWNEEKGIWECGNGHEISPEKHYKRVKEPHLKLVGRLDIKEHDIIKRVYDPNGICPALTTMQGGNREPKILISGTYGQKRGFMPHQIACTLDSSYYKDLGCNQNRIAVAEIYTKGTGELEFVGGIGEPTFGNKGLSRNWREGYRVYDIRGVASTVKANGGGLRGTSGLYLIKYRVRRLIPRECFRLQGFDDSYKFVCSDTQLYKQIGNAVPRVIAKAIAERIIKTFKEGGVFMEKIKVLFFSYLCNFEMYIF